MKFEKSKSSKTLIQRSSSSVRTPSEQSNSDPILTTITTSEATKMSEAEPEKEESFRPKFLTHLSMDTGGGSFTFDGAHEASPLMYSSSSQQGLQIIEMSRSMNWMEFLREPVLCYCFFLLGYYGPKALLPSEQELQARPIPYQTTAAGDVILDFGLNHEYLPNPAIPSAMLVHTCIWAPVAVLVAFGVCLRNPLDLRASVCAFFTAVGCSEGCTQLLKLFVQRTRPNFYQLCGFNINKLVCEAPLSRLRESRLSFPSGHTSLSFCAMTFLVWFFLGKVGLARPTKYEARRRLLALVSCLVPWSFAAFVSATRLADHWHHPADVLAGCLLGSTCGTIVYHLWYPHVLSPCAGISYSVLNESTATNARRNSNTTNMDVTASDPTDIP